MQTKIQKWGNSLAVRIPKPFAKEAKLADGISINLTVDDGKIILAPHTDPACKLEDLLKGITKDNMHSEVNTGSAIGKEAW